MDPNRSRSHCHRRTPRPVPELSDAERAELDRWWEEALWRGRKSGGSGIHIEVGSRPLPCWDDAVVGPVPSGVPSESVESSGDDYGDATQEELDRPFAPGERDDYIRYLNDAPELGGGHTYLRSPKPG